MKDGYNTSVEKPINHQTDNKSESKKTQNRFAFNYRRKLLKTVGNIGLGSAITVGSISGLTYLNEATKYEPPKIDLSSFAPIKELGNTQEVKDKIKSTEDKYNINILSVGQGRKYVAENFDSYTFYGSLKIDHWQETDKNISLEQVNLIDEMMGKLPENFYEPMYGRKYTLILRGSDFNYAGENYMGAGIISLGMDFVNPDNKEESFSLLVHESMHRLDDIIAGQKIDTKTWDILRNRSYLNLKDLDFTSRDDFDADKLQNIQVGKAELSDLTGALLTLKSFDFENNGSFHEGIAGTAQRYVTGYERFMSAFGPLLDGSGYENNNVVEENNSNISYEKLFPTTKVLYDLYKNEVFKGIEYNGDFGDN